MDYQDSINSRDAIVGERFKSLISNPNISLSGFYLTLAERPNLPIIAPPLLDLEPEEPLLIGQNQTTVGTRDQVEEIYFYSFKLDWFQVSTTKKENGMEVYVNEKLLPPDYGLVSESAKYSTWFLGYKNEMTGSILPCIYGYDTKTLIKSTYSNTISMNLDIKCNFIFNIPEIESYINKLEYNPAIDDAPDPLYYKSGELENKVKSLSSYTLSPGVGRLEKGILKFR